MRRPMPKFICLSLLLLSCAACQSGQSLSMPDLTQAKLSNSEHITPRTKGPTLDITPRTKGSTLLNGTVVWPDDIQAPAELKFEVHWIADGQGNTVRSAEDGSFVLDVPAHSQVRLEAKAMHDPELVFKTLIDTPAEGGEIQAQISLESTAITALMDQAVAMHSPLESLPLEVFTQNALHPWIEPVAQSMKPFLATNMQQSLESMPSVQDALETARQQLESLQQEDPAMMQASHTAR